MAAARRPRARGPPGLRRAVVRRRADADGHRRGIQGGGLGQLFSELGGKQEFSLLEVARAEATFSRVYVLSNAHLVCHIEEVMPLNLFEDAFLDGARVGRGRRLRGRRARRLRVEPLVLAPLWCI